MHILILKKFFLIQKCCKVLGGLSDIVCCIFTKILQSIFHHWNEAMLCGVLGYYSQHFIYLYELQLGCKELHMVFCVDVGAFLLEVLASSEMLLLNVQGTV